MTDLLSRLTVDTACGRMVWREPSKYHPELLGMEAGGARESHSGKRYWVIKIGGRAYKRGRLVFLAVHGRWPEPCIDHINGDSLDDRIENLREATVTENAWNHKGRKKASQLPMGVRLTRFGRFQSRIAANGETIYLGCFSTASAASAAYVAKRKEVFREFA